MKHSFPSIEALRHVAAHVKSYCDFAELTSKPTIKFRGTVKLHGTNGGLRITPDGIIPQSRNHVLSIGDDNAGFAAWILGSQEARDAARVAAGLAYPDSLDTFLYGEWCGQGIMKGCAVHQLAKHFVVFGIYDAETDQWADLHEITLDDATRQYLNERNIYFITQARTYEIDVDFNNPEPAMEQITAWTLEVEEQCPYGTLHGVTGIGEGIVWVSEGYRERYTFKSKGLKHKKAGTAPKVQIAPEVVEGIQATVDLILPEWRLEQGIAQLAEAGIALKAENTGHYLKWISGDILKEESDTIAANGFEWKQIQGSVSNRAKKFWFSRLGAEAGL